ncbi:bifunctional UDP-sugar hydrolase/5'-nucleotidase [Kordiimonas sp. SCSIO 12610]|uniref:bifunctional metallophosphatase/5'-nucleotidase n=1 Tax=Kordiimonas sp. SCSIO 12610 TaxID=2829597 RepID=UPI00210942F5|nr:bifunctional UDP-sugar hydrolase/5'-nucleotidase [Kordiimonas sp. SCSIO 12610]UTW55285.1 bifunctional metallophosphatase/5'-nucleotidase [Kordiimonas sp. SCSIO 12610]
MKLIAFSILISVTLFASSHSQAVAQDNERKVTLLFTNDVESAYDPIPAFWLDNIDRIGGIAEMTTLIDSIRNQPSPTFLFDAGDIFTGSLAKRTEGALAFDLMRLMQYDALGIGNHEFEYGVDILAWQKNRAPFPVLGANMFYKGTNHPFAQAHTIIERDGIRIGVIGIMGRDAVSAIIPSFIAPLDVTDEAEAVQKSVDAIRGDVDLIVLLTHQGKTAPMQTDAESDPRLQRDIDADIRLAGAVKGVDILFAGHADAGTPKPVVHSDTGTIIMQTYGQGTHLGFLEIELDTTAGKIIKYDGKLIPVDADKYKPDPKIHALLEKTRAEHADLFEQIGSTTHYMSRRYIEESDVGNLFADQIRRVAKSDIAFVHAGSLRKDIPKGNLTLADILDVYPFVDDVLVLELTGTQLTEIIRQSLTFERGLLQISGFEIIYDSSKAIEDRLVSIRYQGKDIRPNDTFSAAAPGFLAEGGDLYTTFADIEKTANAGKVSEILLEFFKATGPVSAPSKGRQKDRSAS